MSCSSHQAPAEVRDMDKRDKPCDSCANRSRCTASYGQVGCHYFPAWGSRAFDRIRDAVSKADKEEASV